MAGSSMLGVSSIAADVVRARPPLVHPGPLGAFLVRFAACWHWRWELGAVLTITRRLLSETSLPFVSLGPLRSWTLRACCDHVSRSMHSSDINVITMERLFA